MILDIRKNQVFNNHLGSSSWITTTNGTTVQHLHYLPWGESFVDQRVSSYAGARYTFSAKEKDTETGYSYFGARYYSSDLSIWLSVDPMAGKYPSLSPYVYCADNPIMLVDPNGMTWETPEDRELANDMITLANNKISANQNRMKELNDKMKKCKLSKSEQRELSNLEGCNSLLKEGVANLQDMGNSTEDTYHFNNTSGSFGYISKEVNGIIHINYIENDISFAWHECVHIGNSKKDPTNWSFAYDEKINKITLGIREGFAKSEYHAYKSQFAFDNSKFLYPYTKVKVTDLSGVVEWVQRQGFNVSLKK